jgi:hypothetical protein
MGGILGGAPDSLRQHGQTWEEIPRTCQSPFWFGSQQSLTQVDWSERALLGPIHLLSDIYDVKHLY